MNLTLNLAILIQGFGYYFCKEDGQKMAIIPAVVKSIGIKALTTSCSLQVTKNLLQLIRKVLAHFENQI